MVAMLAITPLSWQLPGVQGTAGGRSCPGAGFCAGQCARVDTLAAVALGVAWATGRMG